MLSAVGIAPVNVETLDTRLEQLIDEATAARWDAAKLATEIASFTQPGGMSGHEVSPETVGNEGWFWPWNRAGFLFIQNDRSADAALLFTCAYLAALRFQHLGQYRLQKGMPLCNISFSYIRAGYPDRAILPAILGVVEDTLERWIPSETASFRNLLATNYPEIDARKLIDGFESLTRQRGITALYPEAVFKCVERGSRYFDSTLIATLGAIASEFRPDTVASSLERLDQVWTEFRASTESVMSQRPVAHGEIAPNIGNASGLPGKAATYSASSHSGTPSAASWDPTSL
ncbi:MAG: hypothetical protein ACLQIB_12765 [Isosphaeraceae bacterium]